MIMDINNTSSQTIKKIISILIQEKKNVVLNLTKVYCCYTMTYQLHILLCSVAVLFHVSSLPLTNSNHGGDLVVLYDVQQWSHWLGLLTFNMLQYASFTQVTGGIVREKETALCSTVNERLQESEMDLRWGAVVVVY